MPYKCIHTSGVVVLAALLGSAVSTAQPPTGEGAPTPEAADAQAAAPDRINVPRGKATLADGPLCPGSCDYEICCVYPHDRDAFTQGLVYHEGYLYEGTGLFGESSLRKVDLETGNVERIIPVPQAFCDVGIEVCDGRTVFCRNAQDFFGEGITIFNGRVVQITWQNCAGFEYELETFGFRRQFTYTGQGWGLTHDGERLIMSNGSPEIRFLDPGTYAELGRITVRENGNPVRYLNELEYIEGEIFANVWRTNDIVRIDPATGTVNGRLRFSNLLAPADRQAPVGKRPPDVFNGIAYDPETKRIWVTGKFWPKIFQIELVPAD